MVSNTPETDACIAAARGQSLDSLCRRLELERDGARDTVHRLRKERATARNYGSQMKSERDAARAEIIDLKLRLNGVLNTLNQTLREAIKERDEAQEMAQDLLEKNAKQAVNMVRWRECAEKLHETICYLFPSLMEHEGYLHEKAAVREFQQLKEAQSSIVEASEAKPNKIEEFSQNAVNTLV